MNDNLEKIKDMVKRLSLGGNLSDEFLFTINCVDYFYYNCNIRPVEVKDGFTDGANDGGIDFIHSDDQKMYFIQGKSSENVTKDEIRDVFHKIKDTYDELVKRNFKYSNKLNQIFLNVYDSFQTVPDVEFVLFTNTVISDRMFKDVYDLQNKEEFQGIKLSVYGYEQIEEQIIIASGKERSVRYGVLELDSTKNYLTYQNGNGAIFSIRANSLKNLYIKSGQDGLFGYNLREHIVEKKVDSAIESTINNECDNFWFLNNGITIGCSDYDIDGNKLKLENFSIINGAQTTDRIANSEKISSNYDFSLVCKVVKSDLADADAFIRKISEASNKQKPIRERDLRSNSKEQTALQHYAANNGKHSLSVEIKRGVKPPRVPIVSWEKVNNEYLGQLILACDLQKPGTARSAKSDIFGKETVYNSIFSMTRVKGYEYDILYDLVKLANMYDTFKVNFMKKNEEKMISAAEVVKARLANENAICANAKFCVLALISFFYKKSYIKSSDFEKVVEAPFLGSLTLNYFEDDYDEKVYNIFRSLVCELSDIYNKYLVPMKLTSHSNFFKLNEHYRNIIVQEFLYILEDEYRSEKLINNLEDLFGHKLS